MVQNTNHLILPIVFLILFFYYYIADAPPESLRWFFEENRDFKFFPLYSRPKTYEFWKATMGLLDRQHPHRSLYVDSIYYTHLQ